jgi:carbamoylphosphate synthase large subunit
MTKQLRMESIMDKTNIGVVIGASEDSIHTIKMAKKHNIYVVALDGNPKAKGFEYADKSVVVDISDKNKVYNEIKNINPDFIIPIPIGRYLSTTGYINEKFNLKGIQYKATEYSTDKYLFHQKLNNAGLRQIGLNLLTRESDKKDIDAEYPIIIKPRYGSGSRDVFYINSSEELEQIWNDIELDKEDFVAEQAVQGEEYSVDGAVIDNELKITLLRKKIITSLPVRQPISSFSVVKDDDGKKLYKRVFNHIQKVTKALDYNNCLLNADLIINDDEVFVIEIAPRPSGHNLHNVFVPEATGIDIAEEYIKYLLNKSYEFESDYIKFIQIRFFDFEDVVIKKIPELSMLNDKGKCNIIKWNCNIKENEYMNKVINGHSIMGRGFFIVEGENEEDLIRQSDWILSQFEMEKTNNI